MMMLGKMTRKDYPRDKCEWRIARAIWKSFCDSLPLTDGPRDLGEERFQNFLKHDPNVVRLLRRYRRQGRLP